MLSEREALETNARLQGDSTPSRDLSIAALREQELRCTNTLFDKPGEKKGTFKQINAGLETGPRTPDRYAEIDYCLVVLAKLINGIESVEVDNETNVNTDHGSLIRTAQQTIKAVEQSGGLRLLKGATATEQQ
jgi:hypothetical protein